MGAFRSAFFMLAIFAGILYSTNSLPQGFFGNFGNFGGFDNYDDVIPGLQQHQRPSKQQDNILFPASSQQQQGARPTSPVNLSPRPSNQPQHFQQQQQGNFPNWPQQGNGGFSQQQQQQPQSGGNRPPQGSGCSCSSTQEYNPVCGSDNTTYTNPSHIRCSNTCGRPITILYNGVCRASAASRG